IYGGIDRLEFEDENAPMDNFAAHAVRVYFEEGGQRLYFVRAFAAPDDAGPDYGRARWPAAGGSSPAAPFLLQARFPGRAGNFTVSFIFKLGENILHTEPVDPADTNPAAPTHQVLRG